MSADYKYRVTFLAIYIREVPFAGNHKARNLERGRVLMARSHTLAERRAHALAGAQLLGLTIPLLADSMDDSVEKSYAAFPNRTYIVDTEGRIAYRGLPHAKESDLAAVVPVLDRLLAARLALAHSTKHGSRRSAAGHSGRRAG